MGMNLPKLARQALDSIDHFLHKTDVTKSSDPQKVLEKLPKSAVASEELQTKPKNLKPDAKDYIDKPMQAILGGSLIGLGGIAMIALLPLSLIGTGIGWFIAKETNKEANKPGELQSDRVGAMTGLAIGSLGSAALVMAGLKLLEKSGGEPSEIKEAAVPLEESAVDEKLRQITDFQERYSGELSRNKFTYLANPLEGLSVIDAAYIKGFEKDFLPEELEEEILKEFEKTNSPKPKSRELNKAYSEMLTTLLEKDYKYNGEMNQEDVKALLSKHPKNSLLFYYDTKGDSLAISFLNDKLELQTILVHDEDQLKTLKEKWTALGMTFIEESAVDKKIRQITEQITELPEGYSKADQPETTDIILGDYDPEELPRNDKFTYLANPLIDAGAKDAAYVKGFEKDFLPEELDEEILKEFEKSKNLKSKVKELNKAYSELLTTFLENYNYHGEMNQEDVKALLSKHPKDSLLFYYDTKGDSLAISFLNDKLELQSMLIRDEDQLKTLQEKWTAMGLKFI